MNRNRLLKIFASLLTLALVFAQFNLSRAAKINFDGHTDDNFWVVDTRYCKDGFSITATHTWLGTPTDYQLNDLHETQEAFWLELSAYSIPIKMPSDAILDTPSILDQTYDPNAVPPFIRLAHGDGSAYINNKQPFTYNFFFTQPQSANTPITITMERWDHGQQTANEKALDVDLDSGLNQENPESPDGEDITDESWNPDLPGPTTGSTLQDDIVTESQTIQDCLIDSAAPSINITSPLAQDYPQSGTVSTTWNVTDALSGVASNSGAVDGKPVSNGQTLNLSTFMPGSHTLTVTATDNSGNTTQASVNFNIVVTIDSLISATQNACSSGWISKKGTCQSLLAELTSAKTALARGQTQAARGILKAFLNDLKAQKGKSINQSAYDLLSADANALMH